MCTAIRRTNYVVLRKEIDFSKKAISLYEAWERTCNEKRPLGTRASFLAFVQFMSRNEELHEKKLFGHQQKKSVREAFKHFTKRQKAQPFTRAA
jgi:hypothetical protein